MNNVGVVLNEEVLFSGVELEVFLILIDSLDVMVNFLYIDVVVEDLEVVFGYFVDIMLLFILEY